jgi:hypothetical protein
VAAAELRLDRENSAGSHHDVIDVKTVTNQIVKSAIPQWAQVVQNLGYAHFASFPTNQAAGPRDKPQIRDP